MNESIEQLAEAIVFKLSPNFTDDFVSNLHNDILTALNQAREEDKRTIEGLEKEVDRHRERANEAQLAWDGHHSMDCAIKCCNEMEVALGTRDPVEAARRVRELESKVLLLSEALEQYSEDNWVAIPDCKCCRGDKFNYPEWLLNDHLSEWEPAEKALQSTTPDLTAIRNKIFNEGVEACIVDIGIYIRARDGRSELMELLAKNKKEVK